MSDPFIGSEAIAAGVLTRHRLRREFVALHQDVYLEKGVALSPIVRAKAAWLRSRRRGVLAGFSAAALHGSRWIASSRPAEIVDTNRRRARGVRVWADELPDDEICVIDGMRVTTPDRTALDLACHYPLEQAVAAIDALARATHLKVADIDLMTTRYGGRRGIRAARRVVGLVDPGAESPKETWLRLLLLRNGFPRPQTQIPGYNEFGVLLAEVDMGWEELKVSVEYDGAHHRRDPRIIAKDIRRQVDITEAGWLNIRVTSLDTEAGIVRRVAAARARRT